MTKNFCDICNEEVKKIYYLYDIKEKNHSTIDYVDICPSCKAKIEAFIKGITK